MACHRGSLSTAEKDLMDAQWRSMRASAEDSLRATAEKRDAEVADAMAAQADAASGAGAMSLDALKASLPKTVGLGNLVAELAAPGFRDRCLTFESRPSWVDLSDCATIAAKVAKVQSMGWGGSTDFEAACERILEAAVAAKLTPDEIPDMIVFS